MKTQSHYSIVQFYFERIQSNKFFIHTENMLLAMFCDDSPTVRKLGWKRIQKARLARKYDSCGKDKRKKNVRMFQTPKTNFEARLYYQAINSGSVPLTQWHIVLLLF